MSLRTVLLKVEETGEIFSDKLKVFTLELSDYRKMKEEDCKTQIDYWLYNITNLETMNTNIPFQSQQPIFSKVGNIAELVHMTAEERKKYNISIDSYRTNLSVMKHERAEGIAEGLIKGIAEGERKATLANALSLKLNGVPVDIIAKSLGLSIEEVENL